MCAEPIVKHGKSRMKFLRIIFGCPEGARKWRIV